MNPPARAPVSPIRRDHTDDAACRVRPPRTPVDSGVAAAQDRWRTFAELGHDIAYEIAFHHDEPQLTWGIGLERTAGYSVADLDDVGGPFAVVHPDDVEALADHYDTLKQGARDDVIIRAIHPDIGYLWYRLRAIPLIDPVTGETTGARGVAQDVSDVKRSEQQWADISSLTADVAYSYRIVDGEPEIDWMLGDYADLTGYTLNEVLAQGGWRQIVHPGDIGLNEERLRRLEAGESDETELRVVHRDGTVKWVRLTSRPEWDVDGQVRVLGSLRDVTELQQTRERWKAVSKLTSDYAYEVRIGNSGPEMVWETQPAAEVIGIGRDDDEALGEGWFSLVEPADRRSAEEAFARILDGHVDDRILRLRTKHGTVRSFHVQAQPVVDGVTGKVTGFLGALRDVTSEERTHQLDAQLAAVVDSTTDPVYTRDLRGRVTTWNPAAERTFGIPAAAIVGQTAACIEPSDRRGEITELFARALDGEKIADYETVRRTASGDVVDVSLTLLPIHDSRGRVAAVATVMRDISKLVDTRRALESVLERERQADQRLRQAEDMKERFITAVSHELRTPVTPIIGFAGALKMQFHELDEQVRSEMLEGITRNAEEVARMHERLIQMAEIGAESPSDGRAEPIELQPLVLEVLANGGRHFHQHQWRLHIEPLSVLADRTALRAVLGNLCANAVKYSPEGSTVCLTAGAREHEVLLQVTDEGSGIAPDVRESLFEPFAQSTEQPPGQHGLGVGLFAAQSYVTLMGGRLWVESSSDAGTTFAFTLPRAAQTNEASTTANVETASPGMPQA